MEIFQTHLDTILVTAPGDPAEQGGGTGGAPVVSSSLKLSGTLLQRFFKGTEGCEPPKQF